MQNTEWVQQKKEKARKVSALWAAALASTLILPLVGAAQASGPAAQDTEANLAAFKRVWERADYPIVAEKVKRSWLWGPRAMATMQEPLAESPGGMRTVQYWDKSRMEINNPRVNPNTQWFVTNGLLVVEMISGRMQVGNNSYEGREPARINIAGDASIQLNPVNLTPTYAALRRVASLEAGENRAGNAVGQVVSQSLRADGTVVPGSPRTNAVLLPKHAYYEATTGHNIPDVFYTYMNQTGTIYENGAFREGKVMDWLYATGYPITEPYWIETTIGEKRTQVMMQAFQRRILTYNPDNEPQWRVEMGNVGMHYYTWRYGNLPTPEPSNTPLTIRQADPNTFTGAGQYSGVSQPLYTTAVNQEEWQKIWDAHTARLDAIIPTPPIDFKNEFVVAAFWGDQPNGCYALDIPAVGFGDNTLYVTVNRTQKDGACTEAVTQPNDIVAVSRANLKAGKYNLVFRDMQGAAISKGEIKLP